MDISSSIPTSQPETEAYERFLAEAACRPFSWADWDCVRFAAAAVHARTGFDHLAGLDLRWNSAREAARLLLQRGGLREAVCGVLGEPFVPGLASAGDVVLAVDPHDPAERELLAVCHGPHLIAPGAQGLAVLPLSAGVCAWRPARG